MTMRAGHAGTRFARRVAVSVAALGAALGSVNVALASPRETQSAEWAAVPFQNAQLSVPGTWLVETAQEQSCGFPPSPGMMFAGIRPRLPKGLGCGLTASRAWIVPA